ncbi:unnamed protein product, partial [Boreogadus saida]
MTVTETFFPCPCPEQKEDTDLFELLVMCWSCRVSQRWARHDPNQHAMVHRKPPAAPSDTRSDATGVTRPDPSGDQEPPGPRVCLSAVTELFTRGRSPVRAPRSLVAVRWSGRPPEGGGGGGGGGEAAGEGGLFLARAPLAQRRLLKDKLAGMVQDMAACLTCGTHAGAGDDHR